MSSPVRCRARGDSRGNPPSESRGAPSVHEAVMGAHFSKFIGSFSESTSGGKLPEGIDRLPSLQRKDSLDTSAKQDTASSCGSDAPLCVAQESPGTERRVSETEPATEDRVTATTNTIESSHADQREPTRPIFVHGAAQPPREVRPENEVSPQTEGEENEEEEEGGQEFYVLKVKRRLMDAYPDIPPDKATQLAEILVDQKKTREFYFQHLLRQQKKATAQARRAAEGDAAAFGVRGFHNTAERNDASQRAADQIRQVGQLQVRLLLYELKQEEWKKAVLRKVNRLSQFQYGPFHVALLIGDVLLEWDVRGVVIPRRIKTNEDEKLLFSASIHPKEELSAGHLAELRLRANSGAMAMSYSNQLNNIVELGERREILIDELARVTVLYNRKFDYGVLRCNCQTFVVDVLKVLGIENVEEAFQGKLRVKEHVDLLLKRGNDKPIFEFNSHADLDMYVRENIDRLSLEDLEFCYCHYLLFHAWHKKQPRIRAWLCPSGGCCFTNVEKRLLA